MLFLSVCKSPTLSLTFHQTEISWFFNDISICCISFYVNFEKDEFFHVNFTLSKGKNFKEMCVYNHSDIYEDQPQVGSWVQRGEFIHTHPAAEWHG